MAYINSIEFFSFRAKCRLKLYPSPTDAQVEAMSNTLRNSFNGKAVLITTYTYKPLVGVTSITDPRGVKTTYNYNDFGRLQNIKDENGNIIEGIIIIIGINK